jgi:hypothetical protein
LPRLDPFLVEPLLQSQVGVVAGEQRAAGVQESIAPLPEDPVGDLLAPLHPGDGAAGAVHPLGDIGLCQTTRPSPVREFRTELPFDVLDLPRIDHESPDSPPRVGRAR